MRLSEAGVFELADSERATKQNPDPDDDGDDDSTAAGDSDHDYEGPDGNRRPKRNAKQTKNLRDDNSASGTYTLTAEHLTKAEREAIPDEDFAGPDDTFPVRNQHEATAAWDLAGHAADPDAVRTRIRAIAKRKGLSLPSTANAKDSTKMNEHQAQQPVEQTEATMLAETVRRLGEMEIELRTLREENAAQKRALTEARIDADLRRLSEAREVVLTDTEGHETRGMSQGFSPEALAVAKEIMLLHEDVQESVLTLLKTIQQTGMVPLTELGVGRSDDEHDPVVTLAEREGDLNGEKLLARAKQLAQQTFKKDLYQLSESERMGIFRAAGFKGEYTVKA